MVSRKETKTRADYSLPRVVELASRKALAYATTSAQRDVANLGYGLEEVCSFLCDLQDAHFSHSERYRPAGPWHDVYRLEWAPPGSEPDCLYVKFRMDGDLLVIELCSFHLQRFL